MTTKFNLAALTVLAAILFAAPLTASAHVMHDDAAAAMTSSTLGTTSGAHHHHKHHRHHRHPH